MNITRHELSRTPDAIHSELLVRGEHGTSLAYMSEQPDTLGDKPVALSFQGILQSPRDASARAIHHDLFNTLDVSCMVTIGNNGIDLPNGVDHATREEVGADTLELLNRFGERTGAHVIGTSMGAQRVHYTVHPTIDAAYKPPVKTITYLHPGLVRPEHAIDRCSKLPMELLKTGGMWLMSNAHNLAYYYLSHLHQDPTEILREALEIPAVGLRYLQNSQPIRHHREQVERGTAAQPVQEVADAFGLNVIGGKRDVMHDSPLWAGLAGIELRVRDLGHEGAIVPFLASSAIAAVINGPHHVVPRSLAA